MGKKETILERIRRHDYKMDNSILESYEFQNEIKEHLTMQDIPSKDIEIDKQR